MLKLLTIFVLISSSSALPEELSASHNESALTKSVTDIILNFFVRQSSTLDVFYAADHEEELTSVNSYINEILSHVDVKIAVQVEDYSSMKTLGRRYTFNIFFVTSYTSFRKLYEKISPWTFNHQGFYLIVCTNSDSKNYFMMERMFGDLWAEYIVNVHILWMPPENDNQALIFTYFPYNRFYCGSVVPIISNQFIENSWIRGHNFFPNKMNNLHKCVLRVATFNNPPFAMPKKHKKGQLKLDGIDGKVLDVISKRMNFIAELDVVDELWGSVAIRGNEIISSGNH